MKLLVIKTSSLGDVVHTLPSVTDAHYGIPGLETDWLVEDSFADIPRLHPRVSRVIPVALRRWRCQPWQCTRDPDFKNLLSALRSVQYDAIIDAQGLLKSASLAWLFKGPVHGLASESLRESSSAAFYEHHISVEKNLHAIARNRELFASVLGYKVPVDLSFGLSALNGKNIPKRDRIVFVHGTTWESKKWPLQHWAELAELTAAAGFKPALSWGSEQEQEAAQQIVDLANAGMALPKMRLTELAKCLGAAAACVTVDSGIGHLAAAMGTLTIGIYGATDPRLTGMTGSHSFNLSADFPCAPCLQSRCSYRGEAQLFPACYDGISPENVWQKLQSTLRL